MKIGIAKLSDVKSGRYTPYCKQTLRTAKQVTKELQGQGVSEEDIKNVLVYLELEEAKKSVLERFLDSLKVQNKKALVIDFNKPNKKDPRKIIVLS